MDNRTLGLYVIGFILSAIVLAFIFSPKFRKDVIASEGEAGVLGLINVKGVIIVLLTGIFGGIFAYIIQLDAQIPSAQPISTSSAISHLQNADDDEYNLTNKDGATAILCNGNIVGLLTLDPKTKLLALEAKKKLKATKSLEDWDNWDIGIDSSNLGYVSLKLNQQQRIYAPNTIFYKKRPYQVGGLNFHFMIDSIYRTYPNGKTHYNYNIRFGEGKQGKINWRETTEQYTKTADGAIYINSGLKPVQHPPWKNNYYIGMGIGQPLYDSLSGFESVEKLNIIAIESKLE